MAKWNVFKYSSKVNADHGKKMAMQDMIRRLEEHGYAHEPKPTQEIRYARTIYRGPEISYQQEAIFHPFEHPDISFAVSFFFTKLYSYKGGVKWEKLL